MHRRDAEAQREDRITKLVVGFAIEVHRVPGPGLLESAYVNFKMPILTQGLTRLANQFRDSFASQRLCGEVPDAPALS